MARGLLVLVAAAAATLCAGASPPLAAPGETEHVIEHAIGLGGEWRARGSVLVALADKKLSVKMASPSLHMSLADSKALVEAARRGEPYRIRMRAVERTGVPLDAYVAASTSACALLRDGKELLAMQLDRAGGVSALHYERPTGGGSNGCEPAAGLADDFVVKLETKVLAQVPKEGQHVPLVHYTLAEQAREGEDKEQPQSFMQKYWYMIMRAWLVFPASANRVPAMTIYVLFLAPQAPNDNSPARAAGPAGAAAKRKA